MIQPLTKEEIDYDRQLVVELSMLLNDPEAPIVLPKTLDDLCWVLRRPGSRDALISLLANTGTDSRMRFAALMMSLELWDGFDLEEQTPEVQCNWHCTVACLQYSGGWIAAALETLQLVPFKHHRFTTVLTRMIESALPFDRYTRALQVVDLEECLEFVRDEMTV